MTFRSQALDGLHATGSVHVQSFFSGPQLTSLIDAARRVPLARAPRVIGSVRQHADIGVIDASQLRSRRVISDAVLALRTQLSEADGEFSSWRPNEVTVLRYNGRRAGIEPHLDGRRYRFLVAIVSLSGAAELSVVADRAAKQVVSRYECRPGDLVLLRGPGLRGISDGRPLHQVRPVSNRTRLSLSMRMDCGPEASASP